MNFKTYANACDDNNTVNGDGCNSTCFIEPGYACITGVNDGPDVCSEICGDGKNLGKYQCDDGNTISGDGCSSTCTIETGCLCSGGNTTNKDVCIDKCADGMVKIRADSTYCDDSDIFNDDGCSSTC